MCGCDAVYMRHHLHELATCALIIIIATDVPVVLFWVGIKLCHYNIIIIALSTGN